MVRKPRRLNHQILLKNPLIRTWFDETKLRSIRTADVNLRQLGLCLHELKLDPAALLDEARSDPVRLRKRFVAYASDLLKRGRLTSYIAKTFVGVSSFLRHHEVEFHGFPRLAVVRGVSIENERVPTQDELGRLLRALPLRGQVSALLMAHSGLRPGAFSVYRAGDLALRLEDLPRPRYHAAGVPHSPISHSGARRTQQESTGIHYVRFRRALSHTYRISEGATRTAAMEQRRYGGSGVNFERLACRGGPRHSTSTGFVTVKALTAELRGGISKVVPNDTSWRPYVLRSYASTQLLLAESKGRIARDFREAILGHDLGVSGRYNLSKKLQPTMVEEMRAAYKRCEPFLSTIPSRTEQDSQAKMAKTMLMGLGYSEVELASVDFDNLDVTLFQELVTKKMASTGASAKQELVDASDLRRYLSKDGR